MDNTAFGYAECTDATGACWGCGTATTWLWFDHEQHAVIAWMCPACAQDHACMTHFLAALHEGAHEEPRLRDFTRHLAVRRAEQILQAWERQIGEPIRSVDQLIALLRTRDQARERRAASSTPKLRAPMVRRWTPVRTIQPLEVRVPLTPEQMERRCQTSTLLLRIVSIPFLFFGVLFLVTGLLTMGLVMLLIGAFMALAWSVE